VLVLAAPCVGKAQQLPGDASFQQALLLEKQGKLAEAEAALERARQDEPANLEVLTELGKVESRIGKHSQAIDLFTACAHLAPNSAGVQINLAIALADAGRLPEALEHASAATSLAPKSALAHLNRARVLDDLQRRREAEPEFVQAAHLDPGNADTYFYWAVLKRELGNLEQESVLLSKSLALQPRNARASFLLGQSLLEQGRRQEATAALRRSVEIDPDDPDAVYMLSRLLRKSHPEEASRYFAHYQSLKRKESDAEKAKRLGNEAVEASAQQRWSAAIELLRQALELCTDCAAAAGLHKNLGLAMAHSGDIPGGIEELKRSLALNGNDPDVVKALQILSPEVLSHEVQ
jgi:tetratricopeptide (TPR) repeat protein